MTKRQRPLQQSTGVQPGLVSAFLSCNLWPPIRQKSAELAILNGTDDNIIDTSQCTAQVEPCPRMEVTEPQGDFLTRHDGESRTLSMKSGGAIPVLHQRMRGRRVKRMMGQWFLKMIPLLTGKGNGVRRSFAVTPRLHPTP